MGILYILAGLNHFRKPEGYEKIVPHFMQHAHLLVVVSGIAEILLGILLFVKPARRLAAWGIILLLIAVFPANIQMCIDYYRTGNPNFWITVVRLPIQFLLIWWAFQYTKPERKRLHPRR